MQFAAGRAMAAASMWLLTPAICKPLAPALHIQRAVHKKKMAHVQATAATAALYKRQTKEVERSNAAALGSMVGVASQAFASITTVRCVASAGMSAAGVRAESGQLWQEVESARPT